MPVTEPDADEDSSTHLDVTVAGQEGWQRRPLSQPIKGYVGNRRGVEAGRDRPQLGPGPLDIAHVWRQAEDSAREVHARQGSKQGGGSRCGLQQQPQVCYDAEAV